MTMETDSTATLKPDFQEISNSDLLQRSENSLKPDMVSISETLTLALPETDQICTDFAFGTHSRFVAHPGAAGVAAGPHGVEIAPAKFLRTFPATDHPLSGAGFIARIRFTVPPVSLSGSLINISTTDGQKTVVRFVDGAWRVKSGRATINIFPAIGEVIDLRLALLTTGHLIVCHPDGVIEQADTLITPPENYSISQIAVGNGLPMTLHGLQCEIIDNATSPRALRDYIRGGQNGNKEASQKPLLIHFGGQSLAVGPTIEKRDVSDLTALASHGTRMLGGVHAGPTKRPYLVQGLQAFDGDIDISDAHLTRVSINNRIPPALVMAQALAQAEKPAFPRPIVIAGNPASAQTIAELEDSARPPRNNFDKVVEATHLAFQAEAEVPDDIVYFWIQGEADRTAEAGVYGAALAAHWTRVRGRLDTLYPEARKTILLMQTAGPDRSDLKGDRNHPATDQLAFVAEHNDAVLVGPIYPSRLADLTHPDLLHGRIMGELAAQAYMEVSAGRSWTIPAPTVTRDQERIILQFDLRPDEALAVEDPCPYGGAGIDSHYGLQVEGDGQITHVQLDGNRLLIDTTGDITGIRYALQKQNMRIPGNVHPARRGVLRTTWGQPAVHLPDVTLRRWLPHFRVPV